MKQQPLLTHDQLVDWLIYHCPLYESDVDFSPFVISYQGQMWRADFTQIGSDPMWMYSELAFRISETSKRVHQEITELYWYWTI